MNSQFIIISYDNTGTHVAFHILLMMQYCKYHMLTYLTLMYNEIEKTRIAMFVANGCEMQKMKHHRHNLFSTVCLQNI